MTPLRIADGPPGVRTLVLDRPQVHNALDAELIGVLTAALLEADAVADVRAVVLTGADPAFCAGLDLRDVRSGAFDFRSVGDPSRSPWLAIARSSTPVIGAVNGAAITGGLELALRCDFLVASERASFADTHVRVGIHPGAGMTVLLPHAVGARRAREMSLTGAPVDAREAHRLGLVNHVVAHDKLLQRAHELAAAVADGDAEAGTAIRATLQETAALEEWPGLELEQRRYLEWSASAGHR